MLKKFYTPLLKVEEQDDGTVRIGGIASTESIDSHGEIVTAAAMKAALPDFFQFGSGALREMHGMTAAGTVDVADVGDDKATVIEATVVDEQAIKKIRKGVYKGLSIGGKVLERDKDDPKTITKIKLIEISLVDRPSNPDAVFDVWKAETTEEDEHMSTTTEGAAAPETVVAPAPADATPPAATAPVEAPAAEPATPPAPVAEPVVEPEAKPAPAPAEPTAETAPAVEDAPPVAEPAAAVPEATEKAAPADPLARALAAVGAIEEAVAKAGATESLAKGMWQVQDFAGVLRSISWLIQDTTWDNAFDGTASPVPDKLRAWLATGADIFKEMAVEEVDALVASTAVQKAAAADALAKAAETEALTKATADVAALTTQLAERDEALIKLADRVEPLAASLDALTKRLAVVEAQPAPAKTAGSLAKTEATPVSKEADSVGAPAAAAPTADDIAKALGAMSDDDRAFVLVKAAHAKPTFVSRG